MKYPVPESFASDHTRLQISHMTSLTTLSPLHVNYETNILPRPIIREAATASMKEKAKIRLEKARCELSDSDQSRHCAMQLISDGRTTS
jgi:hypothetical protein